MQPLPRIIGWLDLKTVVPYTRQHILRLERAGKFPKRIRVGANRIGWLLSEIEEWIEGRVALRNEQQQIVSDVQSNRIDG